MEKLPTPSINLAKNRGESVSERIIAFALTIGRVLVIVTETIALGAFLFRFGLDRQLVDLHDRITQEQAIVNLLKDNESTYRNLQDRLTLESNIAAAASKSVTLYQDVFKMIPSDMNLVTISFSDTSIHVEGTVPSLISLSSFVKKLQSDSRISRVSLDKIENKTTEGVIDVVLTIYMSTERTKPLL